MLTKMIWGKRLARNDYFIYWYAQRSCISKIDWVTALAKSTSASPPRGLTENSHILLTLMGKFTKIWATGVAHMLTKIAWRKRLAQTYHSTYPRSIFIFKIDWITALVKSAFSSPLRGLWPYSNLLHIAALRYSGNMQKRWLGLRKAFEYYS